VVAVPAASVSRLRWAKQLELLPDVSVRRGMIQVAASGVRSSEHGEQAEANATGPSHPSSWHEQPQLYPVFPFRLFGVAKPALDIARLTYKKRGARCNEGWCQDIIWAAMLGESEDAANQVQERATQGPDPQFRFPGFASKYQDQAPTLDHFSWMRTAMQYMLLSPLDDERQRVVLFPAWPTDKWDVTFKLHAPLNTTIEASCVNGTLRWLVVTPPERTVDVEVLNCRPQGESAAHAAASYFV